MTLLPIETPIASLTTIMRTLSEHAEANPTEEAVLFGPGTTPEQRAAIGTLPLARHLEWHGLEHQAERQAKLFRLQGWTRIHSGDNTYVIAHPDMPHWIMPHHLRDRCLPCIRRDTFGRRCVLEDGFVKKRNRGYVYVLELQDSHFYIGMTIDPEARIDAHVDARGQTWTTRYRPLHVRALEQVPFSLRWSIEDETALDLITVFGTKARGGIFISDKNVQALLENGYLQRRSRGWSIAPDDPSVWGQGGTPMPSGPREQPLLVRRSGRWVRTEPGQPA